jgi:hypothetical protein
MLRLTRDEFALDPHRRSSYKPQVAHLHHAPDEHEAQCAQGELKCLDTSEVGRVGESRQDEVHEEGLREV